MPRRAAAIPRAYFDLRRVVFDFEAVALFATLLVLGLDSLAFVTVLEDFFADRFGRAVRTVEEAAFAVEPTTDAILPAAFPMVFAAAIKTPSTVVFFVTFFFGI